MLIKALSCRESFAFINELTTFKCATLNVIILYANKEILLQKAKTRLNLVFEKQLPHLSMCNSKCKLIIVYCSAEVNIFQELFFKNIISL